MTSRTLPARGRRPAALLLALTAGLLASGPAALAAGPAMPFVVRFQGQTDARQNHVHVVGADATFTYGTIRQTATVEVAGAPVGVEIVGISFYAGGVGPFTGALTLTYPNGDELGMRLDAIVMPVGEGTAVSGSLQVVGGTGMLAGVTGSGTMTGGRQGPLGTPVDYTLTFDLADLTDPATVTPVQVPATADPRASGLELMTVYADLLIAKDVAALTELLGDGFLIQRTDGSRATKPDHLANLPALTAFSSADALETRSGNLVVVSMVTTAELIVDGQPYRADPAPMLATWEWQEDGWHLVAQSDFNLPR